MGQRIVTITIEVDGNSLYREYTEDYLKFTDPMEIGESIQDMFETVEEKADGLFDDIKK